MNAGHANNTRWPPVRVVFSWGLDGGGGEESYRVETGKQYLCHCVSVHKVFENCYEKAPIKTSFSRGDGEDEEDAMSETESNSKGKRIIRKA